MKNGIYEKILDLITSREIEEKSFKLRKIDESEIPRVVSSAYQGIIRQIFSEADKEKGLELIEGMDKLFGLEGFYLDEGALQELLVLHSDEKELKKLVDSRPRTSIASSSLFTGFSGPSLDSELRREIRTADEIDFLVSFIKFSGLRLILDDLREFTKKGKLRIITTSYMGASDYKAIVELSKLPNTEIKISYDTKRTRLHAKAYYFKRDTGFSTAYIGSSNLSNPALSSGLEWNVKLSEYSSKDVLYSISKSFESYWNDEEFKSFDYEDKKDVVELKKALQPARREEGYVYYNLTPYSHQREILEDLELERKEYGRYKNLVVAATGTGKTMVAAFDYKAQNNNGRKSLLFLAHRKEILEQSIESFRQVLRDHNFGELWVDSYEPSDYRFVFASVQTLNSNEKFKKFAKNHFEYIVIDESHHAAASSYLRILDYFEPEILLGLTATPERMDGGNILTYFDGRIASEIRLSDAIDRKLLSPFHYFGVSDSEDLSSVSWVRGGYDSRELEEVYINSKRRVQLIIDAMERYLTDMDNFKALGFCVSIAHANYMADSFNEAGIKSIALHSESTREQRNKARHDLEIGKIKLIFTVDLFNEGVDIPAVDTVLFLRPTQSLTIFIQQLGRGLRLYEGKEVLTVLDFVGQAHVNYDFSSKFRAMIGRTSRSVKEEIENDFPVMPAGSHIKLERIAKDHILSNIRSSIFKVNDLRRMIENYEINFTGELTYKSFIDNYGIDKRRFYKSNPYSYYELLAETGRKELYEVRHKQELRGCLSRFARVDSKRFLTFTRDLLNDQLNTSHLSKEESIFLGMFHYTVWNEPSKIGYVESLEELRRDFPDLVREIKDIVDYNLHDIKIREINYEDSDIPLDIYASYNLKQIMVAFGKTSEFYDYPIREGVLYIEGIHSDIFFITINKMEEDYLPSTMYNDYAINSGLFNWESQSITSVDSPTGQRYVNDRSKDHKILLFVREYKKDHGVTSPYIFLGNARYHSHRGSSPIEIVWSMDHPIPEKILRNSNLRVIG